jgi:hypothetical protein
MAAIILFDGVRLDDFGDQIGFRRVSDQVRILFAFVVVDGEGFVELGVLDDQGDGRGG